MNTQMRIEKAVKAGIVASFLAFGICTVVAQTVELPEQNRRPERNHRQVRFKVRDRQTKEMREVKANVSSRNKTWRFVHDGERVISGPFESEGKTMTIHTIVECNSEEKALKEIEKLGLEYTPDDEQMEAQHD